MARPREFDETKVLEQIVSTFWARGFEATSIQDIVEATGLSRASLYGAFGDKEQLFERAIAHYAERATEQSRAAEEEASALNALENIAMSWVIGSCGKSNPRGCFLIQAGTENEDESMARELLREQQKKMEQTLVRVMERGQRNGELADTFDAKNTAKLWVVMQQGLAGAARAGWSRERLAGVVRQAIDLLKR